MKKLRNVGYYLTGTLIALNRLVAWVWAAIGRLSTAILGGIANKCLLLTLIVEHERSFDDIDSCNPLIVPCELEVKVVIHNLRLDVSKDFFEYTPYFVVSDSADQHTPGITVLELVGLVEGLHYLTLMTEEAPQREHSLRYASVGPLDRFGHRPKAGYQLSYAQQQQ